MNSSGNTQVKSLTSYYCFKLIIFSTLLSTLSLIILKVLPVLTEGNISSLNAQLSIVSLDITFRSLPNGCEMVAAPLEFYWCVIKAQLYDSAKLSSWSLSTLRMSSWNRDRMSITHKVMYNQQHEYMAHVRHPGYNKHRLTLSGMTYLQFVIITKGGEQCSSYK